MDYFQLLQPVKEEKIELKPSRSNPKDSHIRLDLGGINRVWLFKSELRIELDSLIDRISEVDVLTIGEKLRGMGIKVSDNQVIKYLQNPMLGDDILIYIKSLLAYGFGIF